MITIALGTTPTVLIELNEVNPQDFVIADLTIKRGKDIILTRHIDTATITGKEISWKLTQKETLGFSVSTSYRVMCNWVMSDGTRGITKESTLQVIDNHENWELYPSGVIPDEGTETIIQNDPINADAYATPQMYGAKGDGVTDDTEAIQQAINSGKAVYLSAGTYFISEPLVIDGKHYWNFHGGDATIRYNGNDYAIRLLMVENCRIEVGRIISPNGGGIEFYSDSAESWSQYVFLSFNWIECETDCIHVEDLNNGWSNENQVYGGRFAGGENGVHIRHTGANNVNGWKFYNCGIEGVTNGFLFDAGEDFIHSIAVIAPRYEESHETVLKTIGSVFDGLWIGTSVFRPTAIVCSEDTSRFEIIAPIRTIWDGNLIRHRGCIINGKLMAESTSYEEVTS